MNELLRPFLCNISILWQSTQLPILEKHFGSGVGSSIRHVVSIIHPEADYSSSSCESASPAIKQSSFSKHICLTKYSTNDANSIKNIPSVFRREKRQLVQTQTGEVCSLGWTGEALEGGRGAQALDQRNYLTEKSFLHKRRFYESCQQFYSSRLNFDALFGMGVLWHQHAFILYNFQPCSNAMDHCAVRTRKAPLCVQ